MPKTLRKRSLSHKRVRSKSGANSRDEFIDLLGEMRILLARFEALDHSLRTALGSNDQAGPIPERGRVRVITDIDGATELVGKSGIALAGATNESGSWDYTVLVDNLDETYILPGSALTFLGWTVPAEEMYTGPAFRVSVDQNGNGSIRRRPRKRRK